MAILGKSSISHSCFLQIAPMMGLFPLLGTPEATLPSEAGATIAPGGARRITIESKAARVPAFVEHACMLDPLAVAWQFWKGCWRTQPDPRA